DRAFWGEAPDPLEGSCGTQISYPVGTAVGTNDPNETVSVRLFTVGDGKPVPGCDHGEFFLPEDPLLRNTRYRATATFDTTKVMYPDGSSPPPKPPFTWEFETTAA